MIGKSRRLLIIGITVLSLSGCAFGTRRPLLTYNSILTSQPKNNIAIKVLPFKDERTWSKQKIGDVRNGFGVRCADIIPQNSVTEWITTALKEELTNVGYTVSDSTNAANIVEGEALEVYTNAYMNYGGKINIHMSLKQNGKEILSKNYSAQESCGVNWAATAKSHAKTMELTLQSLMKQILPDINKALLE